MRRAGVPGGKTCYLGPTWANYFPADVTVSTTKINTSNDVLIRVEDLETLD